MIKPYYYSKDLQKYNSKHLSLLLGVTRQTIWRWEKKGMPSEKKQGAKYFVLKDVLIWMRDQPALMEIYIEFIQKIKQQCTTTPPTNQGQP